MRYSPLIALLCLCSSLAAQEKKERFLGNIQVSELKKFTSGYDKRRIVTVSGKVVSIFSIKPTSDAAQDDWGMVVRLHVGGELPLVYLGTYGKLDAKLSHIKLADEVTVRGALVAGRPRRIVADTLWRKNDKVSLRNAEIDRKNRDPYTKLSWSKASTIKGSITGTRQLVSMGPYTGVFIRIGVSQWAYLGSAEYLQSKKLAVHVSDRVEVTGKWMTNKRKRRVFVVGKVKLGKKELDLRDKDGKLLLAGRRSG